MLATKGSKKKLLSALHNTTDSLAVSSSHSQSLSMNCKLFAGQLMHAPCFETVNSHNSSLPQNPTNSIEVFSNSASMQINWWNTQITGICKTCGLWGNSALAMDICFTLSGSTPRCLKGAPILNTTMSQQGLSSFTTVRLSSASRKLPESFN